MSRLLDLPAGERQAAVEAACKDEVQRARILRLLEVADAPSELLDKQSGWTDSLWRGLAAERAERESPIAAGTPIGPYRVLEEIGRGGMAVVYRAERADGELSRQVAIKISKLGLDTEEVVRRFEQERQILADLDHPDIARIYDAGRTEDGRPYFVMELVEGLPIDRYCDEHRLSIEERLELFCRVAGAVAYAHQNLVVHRDLKPSNILITGGASAARRGARGSATPPPESSVGQTHPAPQVKLLDFGIARLLDVEVGDTVAPPTRALVRMMTPEYASPEQVRGERATTASDVYQLGLLLYELLTGRRAYALPRRGSGELERTICERMPTRPSAVIFREDTLRGGGFRRPVPAEVAEAADAERPGSGEPGEIGGMEVEAVCRARRVSAARLRRRLRGDLDNIVLRALRKEPERRYRTADRLGQDIRRHLDGLPVAARPDTWAYRGRKFLGRHALAAGAATAVLVLAASMGTWHLVRVQNERDLAQVERDRAETEHARAQTALARAEAEAAKAEQMSQFLIGLFRAADPREAAAIDLPARELLDRGVRRVDVELAAQPEIQADMLLALGRTYLELGVYDSAERLLGRALALRRQRFGPDHPEVAQALSALGLSSFHRGEYDEARKRLQSAVRMLESALGDTAPELAPVLKDLGSTYQHLGEFETGLTTLERALAIPARTAEGDPEPRAAILNNMGILFVELGDMDRAEEHFARALALYEQELGGDHPRLALPLINLAILKMHQEDLAAAEAMYRRGLVILERAYGPDHFRVGVVLNNLGNVLSAAGRHDEAVDLLRRALELQTAAIGADHPNVASPLASLGGALLEAGRPGEARDYYRRAAAVRENALGERAFDKVLVHSLVRLGRVETELGAETAAARNFDRALSMWRLAPPAVDPQIATTLIELGRWLVDQRRCFDAAPVLDQVLQIEAARLAPRRFTPEAETLLAGCRDASS